MKIKLVIGLCISLTLVISLIPTTFGHSLTNTELEVNDIRSIIGGIETDVKNIGDSIAEDIAISIYVSGGIFNNIDIQHDCGGCDQCGTTLASGSVKTENSLEAGFIIGLGTIDITITASASNANEVSKTVSGFIIGPFIIIS
jgi:hypothetical protein